MPKTMAAKFRERAKYEFNDCFWIMIMFDNKLSEIFRRKTDEQTSIDLNIMKNDLKQLIKEMYARE